jgi:hypothetical protein
LLSTQELFSGSFIPVTKEIDEVWHFLIIQTRDYAALCEKLPGGEFLHHQSLHFTEFAGNSRRRDLMEKFLQWLQCYEQYFGPFSEEAAEYWVMAKYLQKYFSLSLEGVHQLLEKMPMPASFAHGKDNLKSRTTHAT